MIPDDFPPVVYVPCVPVVSRAEASACLRTTADGRTALLAYSALDRLHAGAGRDVPWALMTIQDLQDLHDEHPFDVLYMDLKIPEHARRVAA